MNNSLPILAVETSGENCSAAIMLSEENYIELNYHERHIHSKILIEIIDSLLKTSNLTLSEIKVVAVSMGPGSFTGLRIGLSAVKGLVFGANLPIIPVPTYDAFAFQINSLIPEKTKFIIANKASIEDYYCGTFLSNSNRFNQIEDVKLIPKKEMQEYCAGIDLIFGNYGTRNVELYSSSIASWAYLFGRDLLTYDYDYLEPNYLKKFVAKGKQ